jgi:ribonuclease P protein component
VFTLCKEERLCGERVISNLFDRGHSFFLPPYKVFWIKASETNSFPSRFAVSVPKRRFKRAVKRNLLKRRTREAFRINKHILNGVITGGVQIHLMVIYSSDRLLPHAELDESMKRILLRIARQYVESV